MAQTTIEQFASELKMPAGALLEQLVAAGVSAKKEGDKLTEVDKTRLLDYLRKQHGAAAEPKKRITLTRKQTTEIKAADSTGKARTIQVEVRKKRVLVRREEEAATPLPAPAAEQVEAAAVEAPVAAPPVTPPPVTPAAHPSLLSEKEIAAREEESRKAQALAKRQTDEQKEKQQRETARKTKKERDAEEAAAKAAAEAAALAATAKAAEAKPAVDAKAAAAAADAKAKTEGTLHRPAAKPGEKRE